jgi:PA14 domain
VIQLEDGNGNPIFTGTAGNVKMPNVEVDTLKVNTAVIPVRTSASSTVSGSGASNFSTVLSTSIVMTRAGWIEADFTGAQSFSSDLNWKIRLYINDVMVFEQSGTKPGDSVAMSEALYVSAAGTYPVRVDWAADGGASINRRSLKAKGFPNTN